MLRERLYSGVILGGGPCPKKKKNEEEEKERLHVGHVSVAFLRMPRLPAGGGCWLLVAE